jgi:hypothetical protein
LLHWVSQSSLESVMMMSLPMMTELAVAVLLLVAEEAVPVLEVEVPALVAEEPQDLLDSLAMSDLLDCSLTSRMRLLSLSKVLPRAARKDPDRLKFAAAL